MSLSSESYFATPDQLDAMRNGYGADTIPSLDDEQFGDITLSYPSAAAADEVLGMYAEAIAINAEQFATVIPFAGKTAVATEALPAEKLVG